MTLVPSVQPQETQLRRQKKPPGQHLRGLENLESLGTQDSPVQMASQRACLLAEVGHTGRPHRQARWLGPLCDRWVFWADNRHRPSQSEAVS